MAHTAGATVEIEVVYAEPQRTIVKRYRLASPANIAGALEAAAADPDFRAIDIARAVVGVYGRTAGRERMLEEGDRVEIYRELAADPKAARRARVKQARRASSQARQKGALR